LCSNFASLACAVSVGNELSPIDETHLTRRILLGATDLTA
jgi:hypothetical protein